jgi:membrane protein YqaA with SNARE-associated domain
MAWTGVRHTALHAQLVHLARDVWRASVVVVDATGVGAGLASFLAATLLPFYSEVVLAALLLEGGDPLALWAVASVGNTLGSLVNWALARLLLRYRDRRWFPFRPEQLASVERWFARYGVWTLLLAWAPAGGDALTFVAGLMRTRLRVFLPLVGLGKAARYAAVIWAVERLT